MGYPTTLAIGSTALNDIEVKSDTMDYGIAADYRLFEDGLLTMQAQQTVLVDLPAGLYERHLETFSLPTSRSAG